MNRKTREPKPPNVVTAYQQLAHLIDQYCVWRRDVLPKAMEALAEGIKANMGIFRDLPHEVRDILEGIQATKVDLFEAIAYEGEGYGRVVELLTDAGFEFDPKHGWVSKETDVERDRNGSENDEGPGASDGSEHDTDPGPDLHPEDED